MDWNNPRSVKTKISRLTREIAKIDRMFYGASESEPHLHAAMLERKRDDMVRSAVLQLHTAIEDVLNSLITCNVLQVGHDQCRRTRGKRADALRTLLVGPRSVGFDAKLQLAVSLGLLSTRARARLADLNTLRNKCSHNWLLRAPVRQGRRPDQRKPPLLRYKDRDLHRVEVLGEFIAEFGPMYSLLFARCISYRPGATARKRTR